ncbi:cellulase family glycosylhydrolase [Paraburkholderia sp. A1RI-2L]|uniref:cellulase family glycosylhydrolase n=1 Tax=Paraburkholderia sp. A1RI-2L TaxID=3028367 RepID=UPI003B79225B
MKMKLTTLGKKIAVLAPFALAACSGGNPEAPVLSGTFVDDPVQGLYYEASPSGQKGATDSSGTFHYVSGDTVAFYLITDKTTGAKMKLGEAAGASVLTPIDITQDSEEVLTAELQTLQSLDDSGNTGNGIDISRAPPSDCNLSDQSGCKVDAATAEDNFVKGMAKLGAPYSTSYAGEKSVWRTQTTPGCLITMNGNCYKIKGVTYSPAPVGYDVMKGPALGDLFWDSFTDDKSHQIWNWYSLWGKGALSGTKYNARDDLGNIKALGVNTIRVYAMLARQITESPAPAPKSGHLFTHTQFLDSAAENGLHVLVDIPLPDTLFWQDKHDGSADPDASKLIPFWESLLDETVDQLKNNPAVMGFDIMNEKDGATTAFNTNNGAATAKTDFFYYQAIKYATAIKTKAPDKLVGWAIHDAPALVEWASTHKFTAGPLAGKIYFEELAKVFDYWGVNTYQINSDPNQPSLGPVLGKGPNDPAGSYGKLPATMFKPVIFTEWGWPGTGRDGQGAIMDNATTRQNTANAISRTFSEAYGATYNVDYKDIFAGAFFFSYSTEWWKSGSPNVWNATSGNQFAANWPNQYDDEEGFGLYKIGQVGKKQNGNPWCPSGPCLPYDTLEPMSPMTDALASVYKKY